MNVERDLYLPLQWILEFAARFLYPNAQKVSRNPDDTPRVWPSKDGQKLEIDCEVFDFQSKKNVPKHVSVPIDKRALTKELKGLKVELSRL